MAEKWRKRNRGEITYEMAQILVKYGYFVYFLYNTQKLGTNLPGDAERGEAKNSPWSKQKDPLAMELALGEVIRLDMMM